MDAMFAETLITNIPTAMAQYGIGTAGPRGCSAIPQPKRSTRTWI